MTTLSIILIGIGSILNSIAIMWLTQSMKHVNVLLQDHDERLDHDNL